ncbi:MAG: hypothetical protein VCA36_04070, partial [Opitutales bacterium]
MSLPPDTLRNILFCWCLIGLGFPSVVQAVNEEDLMPITSFPRAYNSLIEKSKYHQNRVHGMKRDLNDYGNRVYDLRRRFDLIFKNRQTELEPPTPFDLGSRPERVGLNQGTLIQYIRPDSPHRLRRNEPRERRGVVQPGQRPWLDPIDVTGATQEPSEEVSPLAYVVDGPNQTPRRQVPADVAVPPKKRKLDYFILPRFGVSLPADGDYDASLSFAATGGIVRENWRIGVDFSYSSNDFSSMQIHNLIGTPLPYNSQGYSDNYADRKSTR